MVARAAHHRGKVSGSRRRQRAGCSWQFASHAPSAGLFMAGAGEAQQCDSTSVAGILCGSQEHPVMEAN